MIKKIIKISFISLLSYLLISFLRPDTVRADAREDAFRRDCQYSVQETACAAGTQVSQLYLDLSHTLYCCNPTAVVTPADNNSAANAAPAAANPPTSSDPRENAFLQSCYGSMGGNYHLKAAADLASNPCNQGDVVVGSSALGLTNIFCCQSKSINPDADNPQNALALDISVNQLHYQDLQNINPLKGTVLGEATPGDVINRALTVIIFPIAGIGLFLYVLWGGFQMVSGSTSGKQNYIDLGKKRIVSAIVGFIVLFCVYWIWHLITLVTGLSV